ncbi:dirigent protein 17-like [Quillaja saponaria]|uniref:Dirigent protein 17-like n=1 Tax=Quillaja saponaria TaxID=32244 RepID=A0AAD7Q0B1_QUISA|nr:dirigent protein 17-like [Quillaja saponaria]
MESTGIEEDPKSLPTRVFELRGEPAIVINGVPDISQTDSTLVLCNSSSRADSQRNSGFGEWLEGRDVRKLFGEQYYSGTVTEFDKESEWYRVVYEDGDFEDLDWHELQEMLLPLDVSVSLKALALKAVTKNKKSAYKAGKSVDYFRDPDSKNKRSKKN